MKVKVILIGLKNIYSLVVSIITPSLKEIAL